MTRLWYTVTKPFRYFFWSCIYAFQRVVRGYDERDVFDFNIRYSKRVVDCVRKIRIHSISHPTCYTEDEWNGILDKISYGFEIYLRDPNNNYEHGDFILAKYLLAENFIHLGT